MNVYRLTLDQASKIIAAALEKGREMGLRPLTIAVLDPGGHLIAFQRQDNTSNFRPEICIGKAYGALGLGVSSRKVGVMAAERPSFVAALGQVVTDGLIPAAGGVLIADSDGTVIGAVGMTGDSSDNDELCALAGIAAAGLTALS